MEKRQSGSSFSNGFMLGIVIGVGIALLLTTKTGKRILKMISKGGLENLSDSLNEYVEEIDDPDDYANEEELVTQTESSKDKNDLIKPDYSSHKEMPHIHNLSKIEYAKKPARRFFRGIGRKIN